MRMFSLDQAVTMSIELFDRYVAPYAESMMSGELPAVRFFVFKNESRDKDWTATIHLKNTLTISMFRCEVYIQDILTLCRTCKMYLQTEDVFRPVALFYMLHGLLQTQHMDFTHNTDRDYDSMMVGAGYSTYRFIRSQYTFSTELERVALELVWYYSMIFTNNYKHAPRHILVGDKIRDLTEDYNALMMTNDKTAEAYRSAKRQKAQTHLVDSDGFIILEPKTKGRTNYMGRNTFS